MNMKDRRNYNYDDDAKKGFSTITYFIVGLLVLFLISSFGGLL